MADPRNLGAEERLASTRGKQLARTLNECARLTTIKLLDQRRRVIGQQRCEILPRNTFLEPQRKAECPDAKRVDDGVVHEFLGNPESFELVAGIFATRRRAGRRGGSSGTDFDDVTARNKLRDGIGRRPDLDDQLLDLLE